MMPSRACALVQDGNPLNDLRVPNGTSLGPAATIREREIFEAFGQPWAVTEAMTPLLPPLAVDTPTAPVGWTPNFLDEIDVVRTRINMHLRIPMHAPRVCILSDISSTCVLPAF